MNSPEITVTYNDLWPSIEVNDYELFDWLDDLFIEEFDLMPVSYAGLDKQDFGKIRMNFDPSVSIEKLRSLIAGLDWAEVERIYRLNNA